jgi:hypothetical protein
LGERLFCQMDPSVEGWAVSRSRPSCGPRHAVSNERHLSAGARPLQAVTWAPSC